MRRGTGLGGRKRGCDTGCVAADKPRILQNNRDLALSLIPLVIICLIVAGLAGQCSFRPGGPSQGEIPTYDAGPVLTRDALTYTFPIRLPATPDGWKANSGGNDPIDGDNGGTAVRVGYITDGGNYLEVVQTNAGAAALAQYMVQETRQVSGSATVAGVQWQVRGREGAEPVWTADRGEVRWGLTGRASDAEFREMAAALAQAQPLPSE